jgi:pyruvate formate lyase activating enzyme
VAGLGKDIPLHFIAFYPANKAVGIPRTTVQALERARKIGMDEGLHYVYVGNIPGHPGENTYCPKCGAPVIERYGFTITKYSVAKGHTCPKCGGKILIWDGTNYRP